MNKDKIERFLSTYSGKALLEKHSLSDTGIWNVRGEDPNCDMGGHHHQPDLGTFDGKLSDIISMAVDMPSFWSWGAGGDIRPVSIKKVDARTVEVRRALINERAELTARLEAIAEELKE